MSGVALKGNPDTGFVYKAQPSAHDAQLALFPVALGQPSSPFLQLGRPSSLWLTVAHFSSPQLGPARPSCLSSRSSSPQLVLAIPTRPTSCHPQHGMVEKGRSDGAVALVLKGFPLRTLLKPMLQRHRTTLFRPYRADNEVVPWSAEVPPTVSRSLLTPPPTSLKEHSHEPGAPV